MPGILREGARVGSDLFEPEAVERRRRVVSLGPAGERGRWSPLQSRAVAIIVVALALAPRAQAQPCVIEGDVPQLHRLTVEVPGHRPFTIVHLGAARARAEIPARESEELTVAVRGPLEVRARIAANDIPLAFAHATSAAGGVLRFAEGRSDWRVKRALSAGRAVHLRLYINDVTIPDVVLSCADLALGGAAPDGASGSDSLSPRLATPSRPRVPFSPAPGAAPTLELEVEHPRSFGLAIVERHGAWTRVQARIARTQLDGWVPSALVAASPPENLGAIAFGGGGGGGGGCAVEEPHAVTVPVTVRDGAPIALSPDGVVWARAHLTASAWAIVRDGSPWVELRSFEDLDVEHDGCVSRTFARRTDVIVNEARLAGLTLTGPDPFGSPRPAVVTALPPSAPRGLAIGDRILATVAADIRIEGVDATPAAILGLLRTEDGVVRVEVIDASGEHRQRIVHPRQLVPRGMLDAR